MQAKTEVPAPYLVSPPKSTHEDAIIAQALDILDRRLRAAPEILSAPDAVRAYCRLFFSRQDQGREHFVAMWLDEQNRLITTEILHSGTLTQTSVYPREVVRGALRANAAAVIFAHNHPSGVAEPSRADELLTQALTRALALVDVKVLDHFIVAERTSLSFAERGLL